MSRRKEQKDTVLIGPLPPPIGGVSVHIARYSKLHNIPVIPENNSRKWKIVSRLLLIEAKSIHVHSASWFIALVLIFKYYFSKRNCEYFFVNHNFHIVTNRQKGIKRIIQQRFRYSFIRLCSVVYVVNPELIPKMEKIYGNINILLFDPFVPPDESTEEQQMKEFGPEVVGFIEGHRPIIISGAWQLSFHNNEDLYGFDLLIELMSHSMKSFPDIGLIFFIGNPAYNNAYLENKRNRIKELGLEKTILLITGQKEMWPLMKRSSLFIRATNTDGDPISIKEALHYGIHVLASDCTMRVSGVKLFKSRSLDSLISSTFAMLEESNR
ncbi:MAG: glycosyltransferase [Bacteroidales bacterium]|nr:glycosyltransferase [Bacteroidales bacterium]